MNAEDRLRSIRLEADAGPLRTSVLRAAAGARREQKLWRWTWVAAAAVLAVAIPANLAVDRVGVAIPTRVAPRANPSWPVEVRDAFRARQAMAWSKSFFPRSVEEIR